MSKPNTVLSITETKTYAIRFTDKTGKESMSLVMVFGAEADGDPGVFVLADNAQMSMQLKQNPALRKEVLKALKATKPLDPTDIPDDI